jgi:hypothetical protein
MTFQVIAPLRTRQKQRLKHHNRMIRPNRVKYPPWSESKRACGKVAIPLYNTLPTGHSPPLYSGTSSLDDLQGRRH